MSKKSPGQEGMSPYLYAGLAILGWSTISTAFKLSLRYQQPEQLLLGAAFISTLVLFCILALQGKLRQLLHPQFKELKYSLLLGLLNPFLYYTVLLQAYKLLPAQEAQALNYIWAVMIVLLSIPLLHQKPRFHDISGVLISFLGAVTIAFRGHFSGLHFAEPLGVGLALASTVIWAFFWLFNVRDKRETVLKLFWNFLFGLGFIVIYTLITGQFIIPQGKALLGCIYIGCFEMGITFILWLKALSGAEHTARVTNLIFLTPFLSLVIISQVLHEAIAASTLAGLVLIIGGILWQQSGSRKHNLKET